MDAHSITDIVTLLLAVGSGLLHSYRRFSARIDALETWKTKVDTYHQLQGIKL